MRDKILSCVENQNRWRRKECLNMIASENVMSPLAEKLFVSDFEGRYNEHEVKVKEGKLEFVTHYQGLKYAVEIEMLCDEIFSKRFHTPFVDTRAISGSVANLCVYRAFLKPGDVFVSPGLTAGGHVSSTKYGIAGSIGLRDVEMVFDEKEMVCDVEKTVKLIKELNPKLIMLGRSVFLFPEPIKELREAISSEIKIIYDAAHVFGLIYAGEFQKPLEEGADIITASTHKTFPGPQGGIIIGNKNLDEKDWKKILNSIFPGTISNHHIHRLPSLAITALEMNEFGEDYAKQTIKNAQAFAQAMYELGFKVLCPEKGFTRSHQVLIDVRELGGGKLVAEKMEENNIIINKIGLPWDKDKDVTQNPSGVRIGLQELTRWGMKEKDMSIVAKFYEKILMKGLNVKEEVIELKNQFQEIKYCFGD